MTDDNNEIETGIETESDVAAESEIDADVYAFADDGEHAVVIPVERVRDDLVRFEHIMCESGLANRTRATNTWEVDPDVATEAWARDAFDEFATTDDGAEEAVETAREYWSQPAEDRETY